MAELTNLDLIIIAMYLLVMLGVGVWFVKRIKNTDDYYVAGRTLGSIVLTATVCATIIGGSAMMGRAGIAYTQVLRQSLPRFLICWGCSFFPLMQAESSRRGRSTISNPFPACSNTGLEKRQNAFFL